MNQINRLPNLNWTEVASKEIAAVDDPDSLVERSTVAVRIRNVVCAGLIYHSLVSPPWFWFLLAKDVTLRDLIDFRRLREEIPKGALTGVAEDDATALRFAEFYGFSDAGMRSMNRGRHYLIFRRN